MLAARWEAVALTFQFKLFDYIPLRLRAILAPFGAMLILISLTMLPPIGVDMIYRDGSAAPFIDSFVLIFLIGLALWVPTRHTRLDLRNRHGFIVVVAVWLCACLFAAIPFALAAHPHMSVVDAVFEATSGLTTTGATVLPVVDGLPHAILYYRAQLNFIGGIGIVVLAVAVLPMIGIGGMQLYKAETPGPFKDDKMTPRIKETAKRLSVVYLALVALCAVSFWLVGMDWFDAIAHSFSTMSLGGFSTHTASIGFFDSAGVELVAGLFSLIAGINFGLLYLSWYRKSSLPLLHDPELKFYLGVLATLVAIVCAWLYFSGTFPLYPSLYHGFFQVISIVTDNGLVTADYPSWPVPVVLLLIAGSFFGGCVGSTCGGIKAMRFLLLAKQSVREIRYLVHPRGRFQIKLGTRPVPDRALNAVWGFFFLYVVIYFLLVLALVATGVDIDSGIGAVAACINNMGVGYGITANYFGHLNEASKWVLIVAMLLGRLELFPPLMLMTSIYWRN